MTNDELEPTNDVEFDGDLNPEYDEQQYELMRASLKDYELDDDDLSLIDLDLAVPDAEPAPTAPVLALVGRPNVGKSTLVNRIVGKRVAVVQDTPGVTRDRVYYDAEWNGRQFTVVDTGGWEIDVKGIDLSVANQSETAIREADAVMLVVDATVGVTDADERIVELIRRSGKPTVLAANKVDSEQQEADSTLR